MTRVGAIPPAVAQAAAAAVKAHLRIEATDEDALIAGHAAAAIRSFEGFAGIVGVRREVVQAVAAGAGWRRLGAVPVAAAAAVTRGGVPVAYELRIGDDGTGAVRVADGGAAEIRFEAGLADGWADLPEDARHGIVRLAAHLATHRDRADDALPASVAALWRPHRRMRLR